MKEKNTGPSKVWLISQEPSGLAKAGDYNRPVKKELLLEYKDGKAIYNAGTEPVTFPVGYVIEHEDGSSWDSWDGFSVKNNLVARPIYDGVDISHLEGELLTIVDAAFADKEQRDSIKSLVRNTLWGFNHRQEQKLQAMCESIK
jgi:hypothetical protein